MRACARACVRVACVRVSVRAWACACPRARARACAHVYVAERACEGYERHREHGPAASASSKLGKFPGSSPCRPRCPSVCTKRQPSPNRQRPWAKKLQSFPGAPPPSIPFPLPLPLSQSERLSPPVCWSNLVRAITSSPHTPPQGPALCLFLSLSVSPCSRARIPVYSRILRETSPQNLSKSPSSLHPSL